MGDSISLHCYFPERDTSIVSIFPEEANWDGLEAAIFDIIAVLAVLLGWDISRKCFPNESLCSARCVAWSCYVDSVLAEL